jgi:hypothetical protein
MHRSRQLPGERDWSFSDPSFKTLSSTCGTDNSGNIAIGLKTNNPYYVSGSSVPFVNVQAAQAEVISNGYRVTWFVESLPNEVEVYPDYTDSDARFDDLLYAAHIYNEQNCQQTNSSLISVRIAHTTSYPLPVTRMNKTLEEVLEHGAHIFFAVGEQSSEGFPYLYDTHVPFTRNVTVDRTTNAIVFEAYLSTVSLPTEAEAASYSVWFETSYAYNDNTDYFDVCSIVGTDSPKTCNYPAPCGGGNSGDIAVGPQTNSTGFIPGARIPYLNLQAAKAEIIPQGYRTTWYVESIPEMVEAHIDGDGEDDFGYYFHINNGSNCDGDSLMLLGGVGHSYSDGAAMVNMTLEQALTSWTALGLYREFPNFSYVHIPHSSNVIVDHSTNTIVLEITASALSVPTASEAASYSVYFRVENYLETVNKVSAVCNIVGTETPKTCSYPDALDSSSSSSSSSILTPSSARANTSASGGGIS